MSVYLGLDIGGTGAKAGVYDETGQLLGFGHVSLSPMTTVEGHTEIAIEDVCAAARDAVRKAVGDSGVSVRAMAVSSQGQMFVSLDENDQPLHPAILWYDSRAVAQAKRMSETVLASGLIGPTPIIEAIATAPKILWLREKYPEVMARVSKYLLLPDYLSYRLIGEAVTEPSTAASTAMYVDDAPDYCPEALQAAGIDKGQLARIEQPCRVIGEVRPDMCREWGLSEGVALVTGTNDQYAGALGAGNVEPGIVSETTGTCLALVTLTPELPDPLPEGIIGGRSPIQKYQFALAYSKTAGVIVEWFNREICPGKSLNDLDMMAEHSPIGCNGVTMLPHFDGTVSPKPNPDARGLIYGLTLGTNAGDIYRAILESISFSLRENIEHLRSNGFEIGLIRSIGGAAKSDFWLQMKADVTGQRVERPAVPEAATLGVAMLAATGAGDFESIDQCTKSMVRIDRVFEPDADRKREYEKPYQAYREMCQVAYEH